MCRFFSHKPFRIFYTGLLLLAAHLPLQAQPEFIIGSQTYRGSGDITIPVTSKNFVELLGWQGSINWDNSLLTFQSVGNLSPQLAGMQFNASVSGNTGRLSFVWVDNALVPRSIPANAVLFTITLRLRAAVSTKTEIVFSNTPTQLLVSSAAGQAVPNVIYTNGSLCLAAGPPEFILGLPSYHSPGKISMPVTTRNFVELLGFQASINWMNNLVTYAGIENMHPSLAGIQFNPSVLQGTGRVSYIWADQNVIPRSLDDHTILFHLVLNIVPGASGTTPVNFADMPTNRLVSDADKKAVPNVLYLNSSITLLNGKLPPAFIIGSRYHVFSDTVSIPVTCQNVADILAWQGSINWDLNKLNFVSISDIAPAFNGILFNPSVSGNTGRLGFIWNDPLLQPKSFTDNTVLFRINFKVVSKTGFTDISFSGQPTPLLLIDGNTSVVSNPNYVNGIVTFSGDLCYNGATTVTSERNGAQFRWQVHTGNGVFVNISDNANYTGTSSRTLQFSNMPANFAGHQYRCIVDGVPGQVFTLRFRFYWKGAESNAWENPVNWNCAVPDIHSDVYIPTGSVMISSPAASRRINLQPGASLSVGNGFSLMVAGRE